MDPVPERPLLIWVAARQPASQPTPPSARHPPRQPKVCVRNLLHLKPLDLTFHQVSAKLNAVIVEVAERQIIRRSV